MKTKWYKIDETVIPYQKYPNHIIFYWGPGLNVTTVFCVNSTHWTVVKKPEPPYEYTTPTS